MSANFEDQLQRQPMRELPREWRDEILAAARDPSIPAPSPFASRFSAWLWPHPIAWAGLGAAWLVILGLNLATGPTPAETATASSAYSREALLELREQQVLLTRLIFPPAHPDAEPPEPADPRRSEIWGKRTVI